MDPKTEDYYWDLTLKDGRVVPIPPPGVPVVARKMQAREPIRTTNGVIPFSEIKGFDKTSRRFSSLPLLEQAAIAFNEPVFSEDGAIKVRWVKKQVTPSEYAKYYAKGGYQRLYDDEGMVWVAFVLPAHKVDLHKVQYCTDNDIKSLR